jgi:phosphonate transport system permease protein
MSELRDHWKSQTRWKILGAAVFGGLVLASLWAARPEEPALLRGLGERLAHFLDSFFPVDWSRTRGILEATLETIAIAFAGTVLAAVVALPLGFLAAANVAPPAVAHAVRLALGFIRSIPLIIVAFMLVNLVGLGAFPGMLAIAIHSVGMLGKFYAEEFETAETGILQAVAGTGATRLQTLRFGLLQQCVPQVVAFTIYRFEMNFRDATVLGVVGAGGIGFLIRSYFSGGGTHYDKGAVLLLAIILVVAILDQLTFWARRWMR